MVFVSQDQLIRVDANDVEVGSADKEICHDGVGLLHRAFSIFIFNSRGQVLLQKRSNEKRLWPGFWSNSVCSHPRKGEEVLEAVVRRLREELGIDTQLHYLFKFMYHAQYETIGAENEFCSVFIGKSDSEIKANPAEIAEWKFVDWTAVQQDIKDNADRYTPWFKLELNTLVGEYSSRISEICGIVA